MPEENLVTGDLVLCTVGSYDPWPAVVVPQRILSSSVKKAKENNDQVAVAFFNDATYYWTKPKQLKRLTKKTIKDWIMNPPKRSSKELKTAYQRASEYTNLGDFAEERLNFEGRADILSKVPTVQMGEDPLESESAKLDTLDENGIVSGKKRPKRKINKDDTEGETEKNTHAKKKIANKTSKSRADDDTQFDSSDARRKRDDSSDSLLTSPSLAPEPIKKRNKLDYSRRREIAQIFRNKLQKSLVQRDSPPSEAELNESAKLIRKIVSHLNTEPEFFDIDALRVSKLHKLIKVISNMSDLSQFHESCSVILKAWAPHIQQIKKEKLKLKEE